MIPNDKWKSLSELKIIKRVINGCINKEQFDILLNGNNFLDDNICPNLPVNNKWV